MNDNINITPDASISASQDTFTLDRPFILTKDKNLIIGMPYLYREGSHTAAVRLLKKWREDDIIYLDVEELQSPRSFTISWNLDYCGSYYLWTLADLHTIMKTAKNNGALSS